MEFKYIAFEKKEISPSTNQPPYYMIFNRNIRNSLVAAQAVNDAHGFAVCYCQLLYIYTDTV
jgi:hypothetical protein